MYENRKTHIFLKDIYERHKIDNPAEFEELVRVMASSIGSPLNPNKLANTFKSLKNTKDLTNKTIATYMEYLDDAFLTEKSDRYDIKGKNYIASLSKYYFQDPGLRNAILSFRQTEENHIMENIIYNELRYRGFLVDVGNVTIRTKDSDGKVVQYDSVKGKRVKDTGLDVDWLHARMKKQGLLPEVAALIEDLDLEIVAIHPPKP